MSDPQWDELRAEMLDFFNEFDFKKTGKLRVEEITAILKSVGLRCTIDEVREMISEVSGPTATEIGFEDLMKILKNHTHQEDEEEMMRQAFNTIDIDGDGLISQEDLQCFMQSLGEDFSLSSAERMIRHASGKEKGEADKINFEQYKRVLDSKWVKEVKSAK